MADETPAPNDQGSQNTAETSAALPTKRTASLFSVPRNLPDDFSASIERLGAALNKQIFLFVHLTGPRGLEFIHPGIWTNFAKHKNELCQPGRDVAILVDSPGGDAEVAYRVSRLLQRQCGKFTAIVPRVAKSAATLMVLGADAIIMGDNADLGPLDAQYLDYDVEEDIVSALDTVQAVEVLEENASRLAINMLEYLQQKTGKKYNTLLRLALHFAADVTRPLFQGVDAVRYTRQARVLKEAQDYAERLLQPKFSKEQAKAIASALVRNYPCHNFVIDRAEAENLAEIIDERIRSETRVGLHVSAPPNAEARKEIDWLFTWCPFSIVANLGILV